MPDLYYVYTVVYSEYGGNYFLVGFQKKAKGYYFSDGKGSGKIVVKGQPLNGALKFALPGGQFEGTDWDDDDDVIQQCEKEFIEECGREISFPANDEIEDGGSSSGGDTTIQLVAHLARWPQDISTRKGTIKGFAAMYLKVPYGQLDTMVGYLTGTLAQGAQAEQDIITKKLKSKDYDQIGQLYPLSPWDDEIALTGPPVLEIEGAKFDQSPLWGQLSDEGNDWFVTILKNLKNL